MDALRDVYITHLAAFLPNAPVGNDEMEAVLGRIGGLPSRVRRMILKSNGIRSRHYAVDPLSRRATHSGAELAAEAVRGLFAQGVPPERVGSLNCATSYPDQILPGMAVMVHGLLPQLPACEAVTTAGVCAAGMTALQHAYRAVKCGEQRLALAVAAENASAVMRSEQFDTALSQRDWASATADIGFEKDFLRWMLSDGAGAAALSDTPVRGRLNLKILWLELFSYAHELPVCMYAGGDVAADGRFYGWKGQEAAVCAREHLMAVKQNVKLLNENIVPYTVERPLRVLKEKYGLRAEDIDWLLPHYSSQYFRDRLLIGLENAGLPVPQSRWFTNLADKGNTGSASIYIILEELMRQGCVQHDQKLLCYVPESGRFSSCFMLLEAVYAD